MASDGIVAGRCGVCTRGAGVIEPAARERLEWRISKRPDIGRMDRLRIVRLQVIAGAPALLCAITDCNSCAKLACLRRLGDLGFCVGMAAWRFARGYPENAGNLCRS